jgi:predicted nucleic acid-binding protein
LSGKAPTRVSKYFIDSNVILYLLSANELKATKAEQLINNQPIISVQVLNEVTNVAHKKLKLSWLDIDEIRDALKASATIHAVTIETHELARSLAEKYRLSFYDAQICASALIADCKMLYSEDMHDGLKIEKRLTIINPFLK